jgi:predicted ATPase
MRATDPPPGLGPVVDTNRAKGLYMWGGVGVGKTMLMDIFVQSAPKEFKVRRIHFHDLMIEVHTRLREFSGEQARPCYLPSPAYMPPHLLS